jgi:cytochrome c-type biogenesis protein CcmH/NrfG
VAGAGLALAAGVLAGYLLPPQAGLASQTVDVRQRALERAVARVEANPRDPQALSQLADALLATGEPDDRARGAQVLIGLIGLQPENVDAYRRLITAYVEAGDYRNAAAATDSLADVAPAGAPDVPFFRALIARAEGRSDDASRQLERFLELALDDPRVPMARRLLDELRAGAAP